MLLLGGFNKLSKKILYISQYFPPEVGAGSVRSSSIIETFTKLGWEVDLITEIPNYPLGKRYSGYEKGSYFKENPAPNLTIHRIWVWITKRTSFREQLLFFFSFMISVVLHFLKNPKKYDLVYCTSPPFFSGLSALFITKMIKTSKFIFEVRDLWPDSAKETMEGKPSFFIRIGYWIEKKIYKGADLIISVTEEAKKIILEKVPHASVNVISNGVDTSFFSPSNENNKTEEFIVGYVGSLGIIHDLKTFIKAAKTLEVYPDIKFVIVGDGGQNNELKKLIEAHGSNNIEWVGLKPYSEIPSYIRTFDIAINPMNNFKAFDSVITVKFYEYLACGVPVITSDLKSMRKIAAESGGALLYEAGSPKSLSEVILDLKKNPQKMSELSIRGLEFVKKNFDRKKLESELVEIIRNF